MLGNRSKRRIIENLAHQPRQEGLNTGQVGVSSQQAAARLSPERRPLRIRDYVQIINSVLFLVLGLAILCRTATIGLTPVALLVGGGLVAFGIYRLKFIWKFYSAQGVRRN